MTKVFLAPVIFEEFYDGESDCIDEYIKAFTNRADAILYARKAILKYHLDDYNYRNDNRYFTWGLYVREIKLVE